MTTSTKVKARLLRLKKGVPFPIAGFYRLGAPSSVQKVMSRLVAQGEIIRVSKGFYVRPKYLPYTSNACLTTSPEQLARVWAREQGYKIASQGLEAAYKIGFQKQAPVKTVLWSDGPRREFTVGHATVSVRHVSSKKLRWIGRPEGLLLRSIWVTDPQYVEIGDLKTAFERLSLSEAEIKKTVKNLMSVALPSRWRAKLEEVAATLFSETFKD